MLLDIFIKGIIIGLSISVPLGPIGMLCIQQTLNHSRKHGIITGLGATASDLIYSIITMFFLSYIVDFIESKQLIIKTVGSIIILLFGIYIYNKNPSAEQKLDVKNDTISTFMLFIPPFFLTLSNPLIVLVLIALFSQFEFIDPDLSLGYHIFGLTSILVGAILWWTTLTFLVSKFRKRISRLGLKTINKISGVIIMAIGLIGAIISFL